MEFNVDDTIYNVVIEKKNNKNLYIRILDDLSVKITCPKYYTDAMIKKVINENKESILKMINKQGKKQENKKNDEFSLLGRKLNIKYLDVKSPKYDGYNLIIKNDEMLNRWYKKQAKEIFKNYLDEAYYVFDEKIPYPKLKIRGMKTRWGVCNRKDNSVTLNLELIKKDHKYLNYVIVHELSHFVHFDHSKKFWNTVEKYCPEYKLVRKELKD